MMISKRVQRMWWGSSVATTCTLILLAVLIVGASKVTAASEPKTVAEIALYQGADREKILIEGAKKEGQLTFYTDHTWFPTVAKEFEKKYPFIKVSAWRSDEQTLIKRVMEEYTAGRFLVDTISAIDPTQRILEREGILQEYYSPEIRYYGDEYKGKGKSGVYYLGVREL